MSKLTIWILATRPQFFTVTILPIILGISIAWYHYHHINLTYFLLALLAGILLHASINVLNDYFDHLNQTDEVNTTPLTPFAGGSRMIQQDLLSPQQTYSYGIILLIFAIVIGCYLIIKTGFTLFWIGLIGILSGYFYSAPPLFLNGKGLGELLVGLNFGILMVLGAYYTQTQQINMIVLCISLPISLLVTAILYINEFPDYLADQQVGKNTLVVRLGRKRACSVYNGLILINFIMIGIGVLCQYIPWLAISSFVLLPIGLTAIHTLRQHYAEPTALLPAIKKTILLHTLISLILIISFIS